MNTKPIDLSKRYTEHELVRRLIKNQLEKIHFCISELGLEHCDVTNFWEFEAYGWDTYTGHVIAYYGFIGTLGQIVITRDSRRGFYEKEEFIEL